MISYRFWYAGIKTERFMGVVTLPIEQPTDLASLEFAGNDDAIDQFKVRLDEIEGDAFGHESDFTELDAADIALILSDRRMADLLPEIIEGADIINSYRLDLPAGAIT